MLNVADVLAGERYTVAPHTLPHGLECGRFHAEVLGGPLDGKVHVQQIQPDGNRWRRRMQTAVFAHALRPLEVNVDLFGQPTWTTNAYPSGGAS